MKQFKKYKTYTLSDGTKFKARDETLLGSFV